MKARTRSTAHGAREHESSFLERIFAIARRDVLILRTYRFYLVSRALQVLLLAVLLYFLSQIVAQERLPSYTGRYFDYAIVGIVLARIVQFGLSALPQAIADAQKTGTLEMLLATPTSLSTLLAGSLAAPLAVMLVESTATIGISALFFGAHVHASGVLLAFLVLPLTLAVICSAGIFSAAFVVVTKRGDPLTYLGAAATTLLSGAIFPVTLLPGPVEALARAFPPFYALQAFRAALLGGAGVEQIAGELIVLSVFAGVALPASVWLFARCLRVARVTGTLATY